MGKTVINSASPGCASGSKVDHLPTGGASNFDRTLPHAADAEVALCCAALAHPDEVLTATRTLSPGAFYDYRAQTLWRIMQKLRAAGSVVDPATINAAITDPKDAEDLPAFISKVVTSQSGVPWAVGDYVAVILENHRRRELIELAHVVTEGAHDKSVDVDHIERETMRRLTAIAPTPQAIVRNLGDLQPASEGNAGNLLGNRFLCRAMALLLAAATGIGKSVLTIQAAIMFALGRDLFGIKAAAPLRVLIIQAENDDGDVAEIRDGIVAALGLSPEETAEAFARIKIVCESTKTGQDFVRLLDSLLQEHPSDLVMIDPLLAFLGDNVSEQKAVSTFLRNGINPVIARHNCGLILVHHTNKPAMGKEKAEWRAGDFAYLGSGSAELANWARAVIGIKSIGEHDVFQVVLGKRGKRAGIVDDNGDPVFSFHIKHASRGICWEIADAGDLPVALYSRSRITPASVADAIGTGNLITFGQLVEKLKERFNVSKRTAATAIKAASGRSGTIRKTPAGFYEATE